MSVHGTLPTEASAINIILTESMLIDSPAVKRLLTLPRIESEPPLSAINVAPEEEAIVMEIGKVIEAL